MLENDGSGRQYFTGFREPVLEPRFQIPNPVIFLLWNNASQKEKAKTEIKQDLNVKEGREQFDVHVKHFALLWIGISPGSLDLWYLRGKDQGRARLSEACSWSQSNLVPLAYESVS